MTPHLDLTQPGGLWFTQDVLKFLQDSYGAGLDAIANLLGHGTILYGVTDVNGTVSDGVVSYLGELVPFIGGSSAAWVESDDLITAEQYEDGTLKNFYYTRRLKLVSIPSTNSFPFTDLVRPSTYRNIFLPGDMKSVNCTLPYIIANFDLATGIALSTSERRGWKIAFDMGGRVQVGWSKNDTDPGDGIWDLKYYTPGAIDGEKLHKLVTDELPRHRFKYTRTKTNQTPEMIEQNTIKQGNDRGLYAQEMFTEYIGNDLPHENRPPFKVYLFIEKL